MHNDQRVYGSVSYIITVVDTLGTLIECLVFAIKNATTDILIQLSFSSDITGYFMFPYFI